MYDFISWIWYIFYYVFCGIILVLSVMLILLIINQRKMIYVSYFPEGSRKHVVLPSSFGCRPKITLNHSLNEYDGYEIITLTTQDSVTIQAYWIPFQSIPSALNKSMSDLPIFLFFHANAGNMGHRIPIALELAIALKCHVYMLSYRGYGHSEGNPSEAGLKLDAQCAMDDVLKRKSKDHRLANSKIIVYGQSLGCAVALYTASKYASLVDGIIIENAFQSIPHLIPHVIPLLKPLSFMCFDVWDNKKFLESIIKQKRDISILFLAGKSDEIVPYTHMKNLFISMLLQLDSENIANYKEKDLYSIENLSESHQDLLVSKDDITIWKPKTKGLNKQLTLFSNGTHNDTWTQPGYTFIIRDFCKTCNIIRSDDLDATK